MFLFYRLKSSIPMQCTERFENSFAQNDNYNKLMQGNLVGLESYFTGLTGNVAFPTTRLLFESSML